MGAMPILQIYVAYYNALTGPWLELGLSPFNWTDQLSLRIFHSPNESINMSRYRGCMLVMIYFAIEVIFSVLFFFSDVLDTFSSVSPIF